MGTFTLAGRQASKGSLCIPKLMKFRKSFERYQSSCAFDTLQDVQMLEECQFWAHLHLQASQASNELLKTGPKLRRSGRSVNLNADQKYFLKLQTFLPVVLVTH